MKHPRSGFTLIELLVVITIIGILAGLSFPAISGALNAAKKAEASAMVNQLKIALTSYQTEYGVWPSAFGTTDTTIDGGDIYTLLIGENTDDENPRQIVFMEFNSKALRSGTASYSNTTPPANPSDADTFVDPWHQEYKIRVDSNYDNMVEGGPDGDVNASILIWSTGKPNGSTPNSITSKFIKSW